jgi:hypothetical protein
VSEGKSSRKRALAVGGTIATAAVVAFSEAVGGGLGSAVLDLFRSDPPLVTSSASEEVYECGTQLFVEDPQASRIASAPVADTEWTAFKRTNRAVVADRSTVEISIQGESERTITLTGVDIEVDRRPRPAGAVFSNPCGDAIRGRALKVDLDRRPPVVVASVDDPEGIVDAVDENGQSPYRPMRFPYTVSLTDPLLLRIVAETERCLCTWRAAIRWRSGGESGRLQIDADGRGYTVAGLDGAPSFTNSGDRGWQRFESG